MSKSSTATSRVIDRALHSSNPNLGARLQGDLIGAIAFIAHKAEALSFDHKHSVAEVGFYYLAVACMNRQGGHRLIVARRGIDAYYNGNANTLR